MNPITCQPVHLIPSTREISEHSTLHIRPVTTHISVECRSGGDRTGVITRNRCNKMCRAFEPTAQNAQILSRCIHLSVRCSGFCQSEFTAANNKTERTSASNQINTDPSRQQTYRYISQMTKHSSTASAGLPARAANPCSTRAFTSANSFSSHAVEMVDTGAGEKEPISADDCLICVVIYPRQSDPAYGTFRIARA